MTSVPSTTSWVPAGARSAVCSTARFSVLLMCSPLNMASLKSRTPAWAESSNSFSKTAPVIRFFDKSTCKSAAENERFSALAGSAAKALCKSRWKPAAIALRSFHAARVVGSFVSIELSLLFNSLPGTVPAAHYVAVLTVCGGSSKPRAVS